jgi:hypothetical protein
MLKIEITEKVPGKDRPIGRDKKVTPAVTPAAVAIVGFKESVSRDFLSPFLACMDRSRPV